MVKQLKLAIKLRKFDRVCPITGYREESIRVGAPVIVQTDRGLEYGEIVSYQHGYPRALSRDVRLKKVIRYATAEDLEKVKKFPEMEAKCIAEAARKVKEYELPIKIINAEYLFDTSKIIVYYRMKEGEKAPNLRELSRDLATLFSARIDFRQLSPRDEARLFGGYGPCGRSLCCSLWLEKPKHVTVKMVKDQGFLVSSAKTAGLCGRLMCCLAYEYQGT
jgi:cell fate regulator YaaT (PSP1 superfamily)